MILTIRAGRFPGLPELEQTMSNSPFRDLITGAAPAAAEPTRKPAKTPKADTVPARPAMDFSHLRAAADKWPTPVFAAAAEATKADAAKAKAPAAPTASPGFVGKFLAADQKRRGEVSEEAPAAGSLAARLLEADRRRRGEVS